MDVFGYRLRVDHQCASSWVAFVLAGELHVEANGHEVVGRAGDSIRVPAGSIGRYWAPQYARMMGVYGPNPTGEKSAYREYWEIDSPDV